MLKTNRAVGRVSDSPVRPLEIPPKPFRPSDLESYLSIRSDLAKLFDEHRTFLINHSDLLQAMKSDPTFARCVLKNIEIFRRLSRSPQCLRFLLSQPLLLSAVRGNPSLLDSEELWDERICLDEFKEKLESAQTFEDIRAMVSPADPEYYILPSQSALELFWVTLPPIRALIYRILISPLRLLFYIFMWLCRVLLLGSRVFKFHKLAIVCPSDRGARWSRFIFRQRPRVLVCMPFNVHAANLAYRKVIKPIVENRLGGKCVRLSYPVYGNWRARLRLHMLYSHITIIDVSLGNPNVADEREYFRILNHNLAVKKDNVLVSFDDDLDDDLDLEAKEKVIGYHHSFLSSFTEDFQSHIESVLQNLGFRRGFFDPWVLYPKPNPQFSTLDQAIAFERSWLRTEHATFNAVVGGLCSRDLTDQRHMMTRIPVPEQALALFDDWEVFVLYATTKDFRNLTYLDLPPDAEKVAIRFSGFTSRGALLDRELSVTKTSPLPGDGRKIKRPMSICLRDGRIYIDEKMFRHREYMELIPDIVRAAGQIFEDRELSAYYGKHFEGDLTFIPRR